MNYEEMLKKVGQRMAFISEASLENEILNKEWRDLTIVRDCLIRLVKNQKALHAS